jgi:hypothetical protein
VWRKRRGMGEELKKLWKAEEYWSNISKMM